jgi:hypothetical protein
MKAGNLLGAFDSCEVRSKSLKDEGAAEEPLPFLNGTHVRCITYGITSRFAYLFVLMS